jgi:hypothetical protein
MLEEAVEALQRRYAIHPSPSPVPEDVGGRIFASVNQIVTMPQYLLGGLMRIITSASIDELERRQRNLWSSRRGNRGSPPANASDRYLSPNVPPGGLAAAPLTDRSIIFLQRQYDGLREDLVQFLGHVLHGGPAAAAAAAAADHEGPLFRRILAAAQDAQHASIKALYPNAAATVSRYVLEWTDFMTQFDTPIGFYRFVYPEYSDDAEFHYSTLFARATGPWADVRHRLLYAMGQPSANARAAGRAPPGGNVGGGLNRQRRSRRRRSKQKRQTHGNRRAARKQH